MSEPKVNKVVLIDDNEADNYIHEKEIQISGIAREVVVFEAADIALEHFKSEGLEGVDLIFLDVNMPRMDGFEFLEEFNALEIDNKPLVIIMLTTSIAPTEKARSSELAVSDFMEKPLSQEGIHAIMANNFS